MPTSRNRIVTRYYIENEGTSASQQKAFVEWNDGSTEQVLQLAQVQKEAGLSDSQMKQFQAQLEENMVGLTSQRQIEYVCLGILDSLRDSQFTQKVLQHTGAHGSSSGSTS